ncbi:hypothetical protein M422DRAFT_778337 [Sphaerobolus stellatus SS14]|uniref:F-box domain-containing protein n=1 Tax=Sphaerobolus stellatus (strain SS14) TaxID=990650 RepID=A0A0C9UV65_SPHS4|nr:hypothetical protein M422DRAFT_778337 [Sphaerobolus stellatus SS14]
MAVFNDLPTEIIEDILQRCLPSFFNRQDSGTGSVDEDYDTHGFPEYDVLFTSGYSSGSYSRDILHPACMMSVCSRWMDVVSKSPRLWTQLDLDASKWTGRLDILKTFLRRSKVMPLSIKLKLLRPSEDLLVEPQYKSIIDVLRKEFHRLRDLSIFIKGLDPNILATHLFPMGYLTEFTILENFVAAVQGRWYGSAYRSLLGMINAPRLKTFMVGLNLDYFWDLLLPSCTASISKLQIDFREHPSRDALERLAECRNLEAFVWSQNGYGVPRSLPSDCYFSHLRKLTLTLTNLTQYTTVTEHFHTPQLQWLAITGHYEVPFEWSSRFLQKNSQLEELRIVCLGVRADARYIFTHLPGLKTLVLSYCDPSSEFLSSFLPSKDDGSIMLPNLRTFVVGKFAVGIVVDPIIIDLIQKRIEHSPHGWGPRFVIMTTTISPFLSDKLKDIERTYPHALHIQNTSSESEPTHW